MGPGNSVHTDQYLTVDGGAGDDTIIYDNSSADGDGGDRFFVSHPTVVNGGDGVDTFEITLYQGGGAFGDDLYDELTSYRSRILNPTSRPSRSIRFLKTVTK